MKLAHIYAAARYVSWRDENPDSIQPIVIGVMDPDPFHGVLDAIAKRRLKNRPIKVVVIKSQEDYRGCHLVFIPANAKPAVVDELLKRTMKDPVLFWRDNGAPGSTGIAFSFVYKNDELNIEADPAELKRRNIAPDGQLMSQSMIRMIKPKL